jgi:hypothetical protein
MTERKITLVIGNRKDGEEVEGVLVQAALKEDSKLKTKDSMATLLCRVEIETEPFPIKTNIKLGLDDDNDVQVHILDNSRKGSTIQLLVVPGAYANDKPNDKLCVTGAYIGRRFLESSDASAG